jgi:PhnB protein
MKTFTQTSHIRHGLGSVRPYLYGNLELPEFIRAVFGAAELERHLMGDDYHVEAQIGDSVVVIEAFASLPDDAPKGIIYVYVDSAYAKALGQGDEPIARRLGNWRRR